jgi:hypothetical protein
MNLHFSPSHPQGLSARFRNKPLIAVAKGTKKNGFDGKNFQVEHQKFRVKHPSNKAAAFFQAE